MKLNINQEICCDICNGIIHNHIDCPSCKGDNVGTDLYGDIHEEKIGFILTCDCGAEFRLLERNSSFPDDFEWEQVPS